MKLKDVPSPLWWIAGATLAAIALYRFVLKPAAGAVVDAVNPTSDKNLAYSSANALGAAVTGDESFNLGAVAYDAQQAVVEFFGGPPSDNTIVTTPYGHPPNANAGGKGNQP